MKPAALAGIARQSCLGDHAAPLIFSPLIAGQRPLARYGSRHGCSLMAEKFA